MSLTVALVAFQDLYDFTMTNKANDGMIVDTGSWSPSVVMTRKKGCEVM